MCEFIVGAVVFIVAFLAVIISVIIVVAGKEEKNKMIQFDDIFNSSFKPFLVRLSLSFFISVIFYVMTSSMK